MRILKINLNKKNENIFLNLIFTIFSNFYKQIRMKVFDVL